ncbi:MAG TPA: N-acetylglutaminylglutamine synthetase [Kiritimatiellia bacterium]|nr:N-acetylglutaminylglutamine synthetase [Kiritimatiellia bacterium]
MTRSASVQPDPPDPSRAEKELQELASPSLRHWDDRDLAGAAGQDVALEMGWGRLIFAHTFSEVNTLATLMAEEEENRRDVAFYIRDPHVILSLAPQSLFLDPSHTYRLWLNRDVPTPPSAGYVIREVETRADVEGMNAIFTARHMMIIDEAFVLEFRDDPRIRHYVAVDEASGDILGSATGVDHVASFDDPEEGSSFWCLAVAPQAAYPGIGHALVARVAQDFRAQGRSHMDLSVMYDNDEAISLYERMGFQRVPVFCIKHKNSFNEPLFIAPEPDGKLNPYAEIIINEARRRGIGVDILDAEHGYFSLALGGRHVICRESLTELTSAIAMSRCDDKRVTTNCLREAGLRVPAHIEAGREDESYAFLAEHKRVVVKPARGEQGAGISVDVRTPGDLKEAILAAKKISADVLIEELVEGDDLRVVVINFEVIAAAVRRPPVVIGTGRHTVRQLIEKQSRRRMAATGGESRIPLDAETQRCIELAGSSLDAVLPEGESLLVRKTANLHTGGTMHDVTAELSDTFREAAVLAAQVLDIPVVGLDFLTRDVTGSEYVIIEANERPGLANHEPQPTAEAFVDMLFPQATRNPVRGRRPRRRTR